MNYYNENDPATIAWLDQLITDRIIPNGNIDTRSILDVTPGDLRGYTQCHFFAGVGGWPIALRLAGWPANRPVWTASCPCQPFSTAGKQLGQSDERHLWPVLFDLIRKCRPDVVLGEQVASAIGKGWLDGVSADLESEDYACGAIVLGAHSVGAPHPRSRLYWVAHSTDRRRPQHVDQPRETSRQEPESDHATELRRTAVGMADAEGGGFREQRGESRPGDLRHADGGSETVGLGHPDRAGRGARKPTTEADRHGCAARPAGSIDRIGDDVQPGLEGHSEHGHDRHEPGRIDSETTRPTPATGCAGAWSDYYIAYCSDQKSRRIGTGIQPLVDGFPGRASLLRGYGNAIVPQLAAEFIQAYEEIR